MTSDDQRYIPAAGRARSRAPTTSCSLRRVREPRWRPCLADAVLRDLPSTGVIAGVGSGTSTLAIALTARRPDLHIIAVDGDPAIHALAQRGIALGNRHNLRAVLAALIRRPRCSRSRPETPQSCAVNSPGQARPCRADHPETTVSSESWNAHVQIELCASLAAGRARICYSYDL